VKISVKKMQERKSGSKEMSEHCRTSYLIYKKF
jgi:hypothetical protein